MLSGLPLYLKTQSSATITETFMTRLAAKHRTTSLTVLLSILIGIEITTATGLHSSLVSQRRVQKSPLPAQFNSREERDSYISKQLKTNRILSSVMAERGGESSSAAPASGGGTLSKLRQAVFPIYGKQEITKFLLLGTIKFFIILALTLTRDTKDTLVVTQCGAEALAFIKVSERLRLDSLMLLIQLIHPTSPYFSRFMVSYLLQQLSLLSTRSFQMYWERRRCFIRHVFHSLFSLPCMIC